MRVRTTYSLRDTGFSHVIALPSPRMLSSSAWFKLSHSQLVRKGKECEVVHTGVLSPDLKTASPLEFYLQEPGYLSERLENVLSLLEEYERMDFAGQL